MVPVSVGKAGASTFTLDCPIALVRPFLTRASAEFSALLSRPAATDWIRKKPSTAMTRTDRTSVVETTRSCSDRCQRSLSWATTLRCQRRPIRSQRLVRTGSRRMMARPTVDRRKAVTQFRCLPARAAVTFNNLDLSRACLVADTADRHDDLGMLGVLLDLRAQPLYVHVDQPGVRGVPVTPDLLEQDLPGKDLPRLAGQRDQQVELERGQVERLPVALDRMAGHVDDDVPDLEHLRRGLVGTAQPGADPGDQFLGLERLDDVVIDAGLEAEDHVHGVRLRRQHHDRHARLGADLTAYV